VSKSDDLRRLREARASGPVVKAPAKPKRRSAPSQAKAPAEDSAAWVREIRAAGGMTQGRFAQAYGFSVRTVQGWERGATAPDWAATLRLVEIKAGRLAPKG
jgi:DNA-binding transcriptional regulator YiaG